MGLGPTLQVELDQPRIPRNRLFVWLLGGQPVFLRALGLQGQALCFALFLCNNPEVAPFETFGFVQRLELDVVGILDRLLEISAIAKVVVLLDGRLLLMLENGLHLLSFLAANLSAQELRRLSNAIC